MAAGKAGSSHGPGWKFLGAVYPWNLEGFARCFTLFHQLAQGAQTSRQAEALAAGPTCSQAWVTSDAGVGSLTSRLFRMALLFFADSTPQLMRANRIEQSVFDALNNRHGAQWLVECTAAIKYYAMLCGMANAFEVPARPNADR